MEEKLLSINQIVDKWTISRQGVVYFIDNDMLPATRLGTPYVIKEKDWLKFLSGRDNTNDSRIKDIRLRKNSVN